MNQEEPRPPANREKSRHRMPLEFLIAFIIALIFATVGLVITVQNQHEEKTETSLPVTNTETPIARTTSTTHLPANRNYATISIPFPTVAINKYGEIAGFEKRGDGQLDMMLWVAGDVFNISETAGETFSQVLDINDEREVLGVVKRDGKTFLKGYQYKMQAGKKIHLTPLPRIDLRRFGLEDLVIETELTLDSEIGEVQGRKVRVRSIKDMTESGILLATPDDEPKKGE